MSVVVDDDSDEDEEVPVPRKARPTSARTRKNQNGKLNALHRIAGAGLLTRLMELIDEESVC